MFWWLVQNTIFVAIAALILSLICKTRWLSPAFRHALWVLLLVKILTPPLVVWPWSVPFSANDLLPASTPAESSEPAPARIQYVDSFIDLLQPVQQQQQQQQKTNNRAQTASRVARELITAANQSPALRWLLHTENWWKIAAAVWWAGALITIVLILLRTARLLTWMGRARVGPTWLKEQLSRQARLLHVPAPRVVLSARVATPVVWGIGRWVLIWPTAFEAERDSAKWEGIIVHELAHLKRGDHWVGVLEICASVIWWFNPLLWYVRQQVRENAELACDAWVLAKLPQGRRAYAEAILDICCHNVSAKSAAPAPACGVGRGPRRSLERRLTMILRDRVRFRIPRVGLLVITALALLTIPSWSQSQDPNPSEDIPQLPQLNAEAARPASVSNFPFSGGDSAPEDPLATPSSSALGQASGGAGSPPQSPDQLQKLEQQLLQLLNEVRSLHGAQQPGGLAPSGAGMMGMSAAGMMGAGGGMPGMSSAMAPGMMMPGMGGGMPTQAGIEVLESVEVRVYRTTYRLPDEKALALQQFVQQHCAANVELRVEGNLLVVQTHSAQDEETMRRFIYLMVGAELPLAGAGAEAGRASEPLGGRPSLPTDARPEPSGIPSELPDATPELELRRQ